jgi:hypothetical protein
LHQVCDLFELNVKLWCQKVKDTPTLVLSVTKRVLNLSTAGFYVILKERNTRIKVFVFYLHLKCNHKFLGAEERTNTVYTLVEYRAKKKFLF